MNELKSAFRQLCKHPLTNGVIVLTIALLIGSVSVIYASLRNEQARYVPFPEPERLVKLWRVAENRIEELFPASLFREYSEQLTTFEGLGALEWRNSMTLTEIGEPTSYHVAGVSADVLRLTGVQPLLGRLFDDEDTDSRGDEVVILSEQVWREKLGGDTNQTKRKPRPRSFGSGHIRVGIWRHHHCERRRHSRIQRYEFAPGSRDRAIAGTRNPALTRRPALAYRATVVCGD